MEFFETRGKSSYDTRNNRSRYRWSQTYDTHDGDVDKCGRHSDIMQRSKRSDCYQIYMKSMQWAQNDGPFTRLMISLNSSLMYDAPVDMTMKREVMCQGRAAARQSPDDADDDDMIRDERFPNGLWIDAQG